jgi:hypothetical protein
MDTADIEYISMERVYEGTSFFSKTDYTLNVKLNGRHPFKSSDMNKCHIISLRIGDKTFTRSVVGNSLMKEFPITDKLTAADVELIKHCYGYILKK